MKAPDKIYLEKEFLDNGTLPNGVNWTQRSGGGDIEYIRKDPLLNWLKSCSIRLKDAWRNNPNNNEAYHKQIVFDSIIDKLNSM